MNRMTFFHVAMVVMALIAGGCCCGRANPCSKLGYPPDPGRFYRRWGGYNQAVMPDSQPPVEDSAQPY